MFGDAITPFGRGSIILGAPRDVYMPALLFGRVAHHAAVAANGTSPMAENVE